MNSKDKKQPSGNQRAEKKKVSSNLSYPYSYFIYSSVRGP